MRQWMQKCRYPYRLGHIKIHQCHQVPPQQVIQILAHRQARLVQSYRDYQVASQRVLQTRQALQAHQMH